MSQYMANKKPTIVLIVLEETIVQGPRRVLDQQIIRLVPDFLNSLVTRHLLRKCCLAKQILKRTKLTLSVISLLLQVDSIRHRNANIHHLETQFHFENHHWQILLQIVGLGSDTGLHRVLKFQVQFRNKILFQLFVKVVFNNS